MAAWRFEQEASRQDQQSQLLIGVIFRGAEEVAAEDLTVKDAREVTAPLPAVTEAPAGMLFKPMIPFQSLIEVGSGVVVVAVAALPIIVFTEVPVAAVVVEVSLPVQEDLMLVKQGAADNLGQAEH